MGIVVQIIEINLIYKSHVFVYEIKKLFPSTIYHNISFNSLMSPYLQIQIQKNTYYIITFAKSVLLHEKNATKVWLQRPFIPKKGGTYMNIFGAPYIRRCILFYFLTSSMIFSYNAQKFCRCKETWTLVIEEQSYLHNNTKYMFNSS